MSSPVRNGSLVYRWDPMAAKTHYAPEFGIVFNVRDKDQVPDSVNSEYFSVFWSRNGMQRVGYHTDVFAEGRKNTNMMQWEVIVF